MQKHFSSIFLIGTVLLAALPLWPDAEDPILPIRMLLLSAWTLFGAIFSWATFNKTNRDHPLNPVTLPLSTLGFMGCFALLLAMGVASAFFAQVPSESIQEISRVALFGSIFSIAFLHFRNHPSARIALFRSIAPLTILLSLIGMAQFAGFFTELPGSHVPNGTFYYRNLFGSALFLCAPFLLKNITTEEKTWKWISLAALLLSIIAMGLCRSGNAILAFGLFLSLFLHLRRKTQPLVEPKWKRVLTSPGLFFGSLITVLVVVFLVRLPGKTIEQRYRLAVPKTMQVLPTSNSMQERMVIWNKSWHMAGDHLLQGVGPGNWKVKVSDYGLIAKRASYGDRFFVRPHNDGLWVLCEYGLIGLLAWLGLFVTVIMHGFQVFKASTDRGTKLEMAASLYGIFGYLLISCFSYPWDRIFHPVILMILCALVLSRSVGSKNEMRLKPGVLIAPVLVISVMTLGISLEKMRVHLHLKSIKNAEQNADFEGMMANTEKTYSLLVQLEPFTALPIVQNGALAAYLNGDYAIAQQLNEEAKKINPAHPQVGLLDGFIHEGLEEEEAAEQVYADLLDLYPQFLRARIRLIHLFIAQNRYQEAQKLLEGGAFDFYRSDHRSLKEQIEAEVNGKASYD